MRFIPAAMQAKLDAGATTLCRCWRVMRKDGVALGFTDHDRKLRFDGLDFEPDSGFAATALDGATGLAPDNTDVTGAISGDALSETDLERGVFDGAAVDVFLVDWQDPAQRILLFRGSLGETTRGPLGFRAELRGLSHSLGQPQGRAFTRQCGAELGDARCGVALIAVSGSISDIGGDGTLTVDGLGTPERGHFEQGLLRWISGENAGSASVVREQDANRLRLWRAPPAPLAGGDAFELTPGCDKRFETCRGRFANTPNFRGFPYMPGDDWVMRYASRADRNDGGPLVL